MGVKLDWDIESEQGKHEEHREDSQQRQARYKGVAKLFAVIGIFAAILATIIYVINQRWEQVNQRIEQVLADTVQAEVAALRVGDLTSFEGLQESASEDWFISQRAIFQEYQALKVSNEIILSGQILDVEVDGQRGRVQVEEIIDNVPYTQTWFYWRYEDGWAHVPPDYTFWGENRDITTDDFIIRYRAIDDLLAQQIESSLSRWLADSCLYIDCNNIPLITVDIIADPMVSVRWADNEQNAWQMVVPSPYTGRARSDLPFDISLQIATANLLAERLVAQSTSDVQAFPASDAEYLQEAIATWIVGRFVQQTSQATVINSLTNTYGVDVVPNMLTNLQPTSNLSLLASVAGVPSVPDLMVDWTGFVRWRLDTEDRLISERNRALWETLYSFPDDNVRNIAIQRFNANLVATDRTISQVNVSSDTGTPQLIAQTTVTRGFQTGEEIIVFALVDGSWRRVN